MTYINNMLKQDLIQPSYSVWQSPILLVKKPDNSFRFCCDYRRTVNAASILDTYPLPRVQDALTRLEGSSWFSTDDLQAGFFQVDLDEESRPKSCFATMDGKWEFKVMPR